MALAMDTLGVSSESCVRDFSHGSECSLLPAHVLHSYTCTHAQCRLLELQFRIHSSTSYLSTEPNQTLPPPHLGVCSATHCYACTCNNTRANYMYTCTCIMPWLQTEGLAALNGSGGGIPSYCDTVSVRSGRPQPWAALGSGGGHSLATVIQSQHEIRETSTMPLLYRHYTRGRGGGIH